MKKFKNYFLLGLLTICMGFAFTACGDDDDDVNVNSSDIVGVWQQTEFYSIEKEDGETVDIDDEPYTDGKIEFKADNTVVLSFLMGGSAWEVEDTGKWSMRSNGIYVRWASDNEEEFFGTILSLNSTTMVVESREDYVEDGVHYEYYEKATYKKLQ